MQEARRYSSLSATGSGSTRLTLMLTPDSARLDVRSRWMGGAGPQKVQLTFQHRPVADHHGFLALTTAAIAEDVNDPLHEVPPLSEEDYELPLFLEYLAVARSVIPSHPESALPLMEHLGYATGTPAFDLVLLTDGWPLDEPWNRIEALVDKAHLMSDPLTAADPEQSHPSS